MAAKRHKIHKYKKRIDNFYGVGKHKYIYGFRGLGKGRAQTRQERLQKAKKLRNFVWPEMTKEEKAYFRDYAMATGKMAPLWPAVMERAFRGVDIGLTVAAPFAVGKIVGKTISAAGSKTARLAAKKIMMSALKKAVARETRKGVKKKAVLAGKGLGKALGTEYKIQQTKTTGGLISRLIRGKKRVDQAGVRMRIKQ